MDLFNKVSAKVREVGGNVLAGAAAQIEAPQYMQVNGRSYVVRRKFGEGGFSLVYQVEDERGTRYALKRMLLPDAKAVAAAKSEVGFLRSLPKHRAVVRLIDSQISAGGRGAPATALLLFEFCSGGSVYDLIDSRLASNRPLKEAEVLAIFHAACEAVELLHSQDPPVVHRDLKVENLLIADRGVVLCDFGSATTKRYAPSSASDRRAAEDDINDNTTMSYRSPEMVDLYQGHEITEKSDVWALGVLLYRLAYCHPPWEPDSPLAILNCKYEIPNSRYSKGLTSIIKKALVVDPRERPDVYDILQDVIRLRNKKMSSTMQSRMQRYRQRTPPARAQQRSQSSSNSARAQPDDAFARLHSRAEERREREQRRRERERRQMRGRNGSNSASSRSPAPTTAAPHRSATHAASTPAGVGSGAVQSKVSSALFDALEWEDAPATTSNSGSATSSNASLLTPPGSNQGSLLDMNLNGQQPLPPLSNGSGAAFTPPMSLSSSGSSFASTPTATPSLSHPNSGATANQQWQVSPSATPPAQHRVGAQPSFHPTQFQQLQQQQQQQQQQHQFPQQSFSQFSSPSFTPTGSQTASPSLQHSGDSFQWHSAPTSDAPSSASGFQADPFAVQSFPPQQTYTMQPVQQARPPQPSGKQSKSLAQMMEENMNIT